MKARGHKASSKQTPDVSAADIVDLLPDAVVQLDREGRVTFANEAAEALFNTGKNQMQGRPVDDYLPAQKSWAPDSVLRDMTLAGKKISAVFIKELPHAAGRLIVLRHDIIDMNLGWIERARTALQPARHIARVLAHEIKNPLTGIRAAAQILSHSELKDEDRELAELVQRESDRIFRLINRVNVFDDSAVATGLVNIHAALDQAVASAGASFNGKIKTFFDPSLPDVHADEDGLVQVFLNIIKNAAEAGAENILIKTSYSATAPYHPESGVKLPVTVTIEDDGRGMNDETLKRMFEPYYTTKPAGEGLGLAIVLKMIDDWGGVVDAASGEGKTVFRLNFMKDNST